MTSLKHLIEYMEKQATWLAASDMMDMEKYHTALEVMRQSLEQPEEREGVMTDYTNKLTITFEHPDGIEAVSFERKGGISCDDIFWLWFMNAWPAVGLDFVKKGIEEND